MKSALPLSILLLAAVATVPTEASASRPVAGRIDHGGLDLADGRTLPHRQAAVWRAAVAAPDRARALDGLTARTGRAWVAWDDATEVPRRILFAHADAPGTVADPWEAARVAKAYLAEHIELLAPGASPSDFVLVSNHLGADIRSIGFQQQVDGREVLGGQVSFRFKHDRLVAIGSEALPHVVVPAAAHLRDRALARFDAEDFIASSVDGRIRAVSAAEGPFILPLVDAVTGPAYREVLRIEVDVEAPHSRWLVYVDAQTGAPVAREQTLTFASGNVLYDAPIRSPSFGDRNNYWAAQTQLTVDGGIQVSDAFGAVEFANATALVVTALEGPFIRIQDDSIDLASQELFVGDGGVTTWSAAGDELVDAQISAYIHAGIVKNHVRGIDPTLGYLDQQLTVVTNIADECNAFSDGDTIHFFQASGLCENTGLISDVVYHEYGHSVHRQSIIQGVGGFDGALSEGIADYLSMTIVGDSGLARGFFFSDEPLRELDPPDYEYRWPDDAGEVHYAGQIIGGALWDLRKALIQKHGPANGAAITDRIYYESTRRAVDIPTMYPEALVVDDDDGDLANGTPNGCDIQAAYGPHGLFSGGPESEKVTLLAAPEGYRVDLQLDIPSFPDCPVTATARLEYRLREGGQGETSVDMSPADGGYTATFPADAQGQVMQYRVHVEYSNGAERVLPTNRADPWYEVFVGEVTPLYCTGFADALDEGWALDGDFAIGPLGGESGHDPADSYDDDGIVLGNRLDGSGEYDTFSSPRAASPPILFDPTGFDSIRLQYRRWLTVEDGYFDRAELEIDGERAWANLATEQQELATVHHRDSEWRFHDLEITEAAADGQIDLAFSLSTDGGLEMGGWTVDELCVVGWSAGASGCGNGVMDPGEGCDDGNLIDGDGCSATCTVETDVPGDDDDDDGPGGSGDDDDDDDDGPGADGGDDAGLDDGGVVGRGCGCRQSSSAPDGAGWSGLALLGLWAFRRRRRGISS